MIVIPFNDPVLKTDQYASLIRCGLIQFVNCSILRGRSFVTEDFWIERGRIINPEPVFYVQKRLPQLKIDCLGNIIAPGFIDVQINGLHLEGPFININKKGAHSYHHFINGFENGFDDLVSTYGLDLSQVSLITLAPELPQSIKVIELLVSHGINSLGHSMASISIGEAAINAGASCITHLFNAMLPFHHRDPGLVGLLTSANIDPDKTLFFGVISDGVHTHDAALRIAYRTHPDGLILVTDAVALLGLDEGSHRLGDMNITIHGKKAIIAGTETITGSISPLDYCVRHFIKASRCNGAEALICASLHPAQFLGIEDRKGTLNFGQDADFLILSADFLVLSTYVSGRLVWTKS